MKIITTKEIFIVTILVVLLTIFSIWFLGLGEHRTIFENSILSTSILSFVFFVFLSYGLYNGFKLKDNLGQITDKINSKNNIADLGNGFDVPINMLDIGDDFAGVIVGILAWILFSIILLLFIWFFGAIIWTMILVFIAMLYWVFFRAIRLVFKNSYKCRGNIKPSVSYAFSYTILYNFWIYIVILISHYLV